MKNRFIKDKSKLKEIIKKLSLININQTDYDESFKFRVVMTDETNDRHGEVLKADGMLYENFMKNPVILCDHSYKVESIMGKAINIIYDEDLKQWICEGIFSKTNPKAEVARQLYNEGMLKAVSVGLMPYYDPSDWDTIKAWELLELSFVAVPANPNAVSTDNKELLKKGVEFGLIKEIEEGKEEEEETEEEVIDTPENPSEIAQLKEEIKELKTLMKDLISLVQLSKKEDGNSDYEAVDALQTVARNANEALRLIKLKQKS